MVASGGSMLFFVVALVLALVGLDLIAVLRERQDV